MVCGDDLGPPWGEKAAWAWENGVETPGVATAPCWDWEGVRPCCEGACFIGVGVDIVMCVSDSVSKKGQPIPMMEYYTVYGVSEVDLTGSKSAMSGVRCLEHAGQRRGGVCSHRDEARMAHACARVAPDQAGSSQLSSQQIIALVFLLQERFCLARFTVTGSDE